MAQVAGIQSLQKALSSGQGQHVWLDGERGLVFGTFPTITAHFDFGGEVLVDAAPQAPKTKREVSFLHDCPRVTQRFIIETDDALYKVGSFKQLLVEGLNIIEDLAPGTIAMLSAEKGRTKRAVAPTREELYEVAHPDSHSTQLRNGYFVATNNKSTEAVGYFNRAIDLAKLRKRISYRFA